MQLLKDVQSRCPAYLGLGEKTSELLVLGTPADQRQTLVGSEGSSSSLPMYHHCYSYDYDYDYD